MLGDNIAMERHNMRMKEERRKQQILATVQHYKEQARKREDALDRIIEEKWLGAKAVVGIWPANSVEDDIEVGVNGETVRFHTVRQQQKKAASSPNFALADLVAPKDSGIKDHIGGYPAIGATNPQGVGMPRLIEFVEILFIYLQSLLYPRFILEQQFFVYFHSAN